MNIFLWTETLAACATRTACVTYSACVTTVACITVPACSCRTFWLGEGAIWCIHRPMKRGNTHWMLNFWHNFAIKMCCRRPKKQTFSKMVHPFLDHSIQEWLRDDLKCHFFTIPGNDRNDVGMTSEWLEMSVFIIPRNDRNDVGMTQEWLEMSFLIIPRNDRNDVGMMVWLIQCPFLSFLSFVIFLCHSFISASFRHSKLISEWWAMRKMRNDVEWMTKVDYFPLMESGRLHPIHSFHSLWGWGRNGKKTSF